MCIYRLHGDKKYQYFPSDGSNLVAQTQKLLRENPGATSSERSNRENQGESGQKYLIKEQPYLFP